MDFIQYGYIGLFISSVLAGSIIPFSSEIILSALIVSDYNVFTCFIVATIGNFIGGQFTYFMGYLGKWSWIEKYFKIKKEKIESTYQKINKYGAYSAVLSFIPGIGNAILLTLGFFKVKPIHCAIFMLLGKISRYVVWIYITLNTSKIITG